MRTFQLAEKKQTLAGMHRYQRDLLVVLAGRSLVRPGLQARQMILEGSEPLAWHPTIPDRAGTPHDHPRGSCRLGNQVAVAGARKSGLGASILILRLRALKSRALVAADQSDPL